MNYQVWERSVPPQIRADGVWSQEPYRLALFLADIAWHDANDLAKHRRTIKLGADLLEAMSGVAAGLARAHDRSLAAERRIALEESLAFARVGAGIYHGCRHVLGQEIIMHRIRVLNHVVGRLKELGAGSPEGQSNGAEVALPVDKLEPLLQQVPLP
jgi:hypothetical protein